MRKEAADRPFFITAATLFVVLVFLAFAQRYYLGWLFRSPHLSLFLQVHGAIMSGWVLMFIVQTGWWRPDMCECIGSSAPWAPAGPYWW